MLRNVIVARHLLETLLETQIWLKCTRGVLTFLISTFIAVLTCASAGLLGAGLQAVLCAGHMTPTLLSIMVSDFFMILLYLVILIVLVMVI